MIRSYEEKIEELLRNIQVLAIVCYQWGDTGKGKLVDMLAEFFDIIARGTGADNAGHTICTKTRKIIAHLVPSGILRDGDGKITIIGTGVAVNPGILLGEIRELLAAGVTCDNLMLSLSAKVTLPQHVLLDRLGEIGAGKAKIGTTGRGVGPVFTDHYARKGLIINDLLNGKDQFVAKLRRNLRDKMPLLAKADPELIRDIMQHKHLEFGAFYHPTDFIDVDAVAERYLALGQELKQIVRNTDLIMKNAVHKEKKKVLLEGAQGLMLSVDKGSYPYVTASDCSDQGLAQGVGLHGRDIDLVLGIVKAFYMTRVGGGPFPTEMGGIESAAHCDAEGMTEARELEMYPAASVNAPDGKTRGVAIRQEGREYGATTGRPRRTGRLDLPILRYAIQECGPDVVLTKVDVLSKCEVIEICDHYIYRGAPYQYGDVLLKDGDRIDVAIPHCEVLANCEPQYEDFPGWLENIQSVRDISQLPRKVWDILGYIEKSTGAHIRIVSVGADREETIIVE
jgi:adenylosuccinate synthase